MLPSFNVPAQICTSFLEADNAVPQKSVHTFSKFNLMCKQPHLQSLLQLFADVPQMIAKLRL